MFYDKSNAATMKAVLIGSSVLDVAIKDDEAGMRFPNPEEPEPGERQNGF